jgi:hypothetical protein
MDGPRDWHCSGQNHLRIMLSFFMFFVARSLSGTRLIVNGHKQNGTVLTSLMLRVARGHWDTPAWTNIRPKAVPSSALPLSSNKKKLSSLRHVATRLTSVSLKANSWGLPSCHIPSHNHFLLSDKKWTILYTCIQYWDRLCYFIYT